MSPFEDGSGFTMVGFGDTGDVGSVFTSFSSNFKINFFSPSLMCSVIDINCATFSSRYSNLPELLSNGLSSMSCRSAESFDKLDKGDREMQESAATSSDLSKISATMDHQMLTDSYAQCLKRE